MKKIISLVLCLVMLAGVSVFCFTSCNGEDGGTIKIGFSGPLSGGAAMYGIAVKNSAQMAVDEINAMDDNGLNGIKFELIFRDDVHDATKIETNFTQLLADGMQISLGTVTTKPGLAFKTLAKDQNLFYLTPSASGDDIPVDSMGYQMCFADSNQGAASAEIFNEVYQGKKIGVFYKSDDDYSKGIYDKFKATLSADLKAGLVEASFTESTSADFSTQVNALKACDVIFMPIYYTPASLFMSQGVGIIKADATYYGCDGLDGIDAIDGFDITTIPQKVSYLSHFNSNATEGPAADYIAAYKAKFGAEAPLNQFGAAAYDCVYAIYEALKATDKKVTSDLSPAEYTAILSEVFNGDFTFHGITGETSATEKSDISWESTGYVNKKAVSYVVKEANAN
jgi:branched-chain amino acid transport system substrate-binding protein